MDWGSAHLLFLVVVLAGDLYSRFNVGILLERGMVEVLVLGYFLIICVIHAGIYCRSSSTTNFGASLSLGSALGQEPSAPETLDISDNLQTCTNVWDYWGPGVRANTLPSLAGNNFGIAEKNFV